MPEGPEVKLFVDKLNNIYKNKTIKSVKVDTGRYVKKPINNLSTLNNLKINFFNCKGKFIWMDLGEVIVFNTLGMTGSWNSRKTKHTRISINFTEGNPLYFNDIRNFGTFQIKTKNDLEKKLKTIGPDMLSNPPEDFVSIIKKHSNKNICEVLMNQKVISGVGNYIKAEALWYSKINPYSIVKNIPDLNIKVLGKAIEFVINKSYKSQGASIKDYYTFEGESGNATNGFVVYSKSCDPYKEKVIKEKTPDKRTTHWVKERQTIGL